MGACYSLAGDHNPLYVSRLPARVALRNSKTGDKVDYEPYQHFVRDFNPAKPFVSARLPKAAADAEFELTVADADGKLLYNPEGPVKFSRNGIAPPVVRSPRLEIDALGQIWIDNLTARWIEIEEPSMANRPAARDPSRIEGEAAEA